MANVRFADSVLTALLKKYATWTGDRTRIVVVRSQYYTDGPRLHVYILEDKGNNNILESNFAAKRQRQFLQNFLSVEKEPKNKNGTHQRLLREGVKNEYPTR